MSNFENILVVLLRAVFAAEAENNWPEAEQACAAINFLEELELEVNNLRNKLDTVRRITER